MSLVWRMGALPPRPVTAFVHVYNQRGELVAQRDAPLGGSDVAGRYAPPSQWQAGDRIADRYTITLPTSLPVEGQRLAVGLYDAQTLERLPALTPAGAPLPDDLFDLDPGEAP